MRPWLLCGLVVGGSISQTQAQTHARILLRAEPGSRHFWCRYTMWLPANRASGPLLLNLNKRFTILSVQSPRLGELAIGPYLYPAFQDTVQGITLAYPGRKYHRRRVKVTYEGTLSDKFATAQIMEFSRNTLWMPFLPYQEDELLNYQLDVRVPEAYAVASTRPPTQQRAGRFQFRGRTAAIEPTALVSNNFHRLAARPAVTVVKAGPLLLPDSLLPAEAARIIRFYNQTIGRQDTISRFSVLLPGTNRNASGLLDNAVNITYSDFDVRKPGDRLILAHEISHKWWAYGSIGSYEEWLNEAFATYSSLLYLQATGDTTRFRQELDIRLKSAVDAPAIIGFDKTKHDYLTIRRVVYAKGTAVLAALHNRLGDEKFLRILATTAAQRIATTEGFLAIVTQEAGADTRRWLYDELTH